MAKCSAVVDYCATYHLGGVVMSAESSLVHIERFSIKQRLFFTCRREYFNMFHSLQADLTQLEKLLRVNKYFM